MKKVGIGPLCGEIRTRPSPFRTARAVNGVSGITLWGSNGAQELWFNPGGLLPDLVGNIVVAKFLSRLPGNDANVQRC